MTAITLNQRQTPRWFSLFRKTAKPVQQGVTRKKTKPATQARKKSANTQHPAMHPEILLKALWQYRKSLLLLTVFLVAVIVYLLPKSSWLPLDQIRIQGSFQHLDEQRVKQLLQPYLGTGFFIVDIEQLQQRLIELPWVANASVQRHWPDRIDVAITEHSAYARWDENRLLSRKGILFEASAAEFAGLPQIQGYAAESQQVLERYLQLLARFSAQGLGISEYHEDAKGAVSLRLNNEIAINFGSIDSEQKIASFLDIYPLAIAAKATQIQSIDFRYSNGFAIGWKPTQTDATAYRSTGHVKKV